MTDNNIILLCNLYWFCNCHTSTVTRVWTPGINSIDVINTIRINCTMSVGIRNRVVVTTSDTSLIPPLSEQLWPSYKCIGLDYLCGVYTIIYNMLWLGTWRHMHYAHQRTCTRGRIPATVDIACRQEHATNRFLTTHNCRRIFSSYTQYIYTKELEQSHRMSPTDVILWKHNRMWSTSPQADVYRPINTYGCTGSPPYPYGDQVS